MAHEHLGTPNHTVPSFTPSFEIPRFASYGAHVDEPTVRLDASGALSSAGATFESRYVMVQSAAPVAVEDCEELGVSAIEVTVLWGTNVLHVAHLSPPRAFSVGHGEGTRVDFVVPAELAPFARTEIVAVRDGTALVLAPQGAELTVRNRAASASSEGARSVVLGDGTVADVRFGALSFRISSVTAGKRLPRSLGTDTGGLGSSFMATFAAVATVLGSLAYYTPALGSTLDDELDRERLATMLAFLNTQAEREEKVTPSDGEAKASQGGGTPGTAAKGPEGKMGRPDKPAAEKRFAISGGGEVVLSREQRIAEASTFGMIGMLSSMNSRSVPQATWGENVPMGPDAVDAWGNMFGEDIGESAGAGGLGLIGIGSGAGGHGDQIGIGAIGTCGTNCGMGNGKWGVGPGMGSSIGSTGNGHKTKVPTMRAGATTVNGHIPSEVIQRIVRQNYGRFRQCYDSGLRTNPNLTGRVTARFVIGRDGSVSNVSNGGGDLPDSAVTSCVLSAFYGLSFPSPDGGIVTVTYPLMLVPG